MVESVQSDFRAFTAKLSVDPILSGLGYCFITVMTLSCRRDWSGQTVQTQI